jgi:signal-transduction protein with cAMP-binding, CBS, and nucleotidyltransferase domain
MPSDLLQDLMGADEAWMAGFLPFSRLGPEAIADLAQAMRARHVATGEQVMEAGSDVAELLLLREGAATVTQHKAGRLGKRKSV